MRPMTVYEATALTVAMKEKVGYKKPITVYTAIFVAREFERRIRETKGKIFFNIEDVRE